LSRKRVIIVSPLNWGLGHASRCIPVVEALVEHEFEPVLAGDGASLELLASEFPALRTYELPSYGIRYAKNPGLFRLKLLSQVPNAQKVVSREHKKVQDIVSREKASGIISDNRFGVYSKKVPSVYLTHQLSIRAGWISGPASIWNQRLISKFDYCWVCDFKGDNSLAGELSSNPGRLKNVEWIGPLSRFPKNKREHSNGPSNQLQRKVDIGIVLSGPEPSRSQFEQKVVEVLKGRQEKVVLVRGVMDTQSCRTDQNLTIHNYMLTDELEELMLRSGLLIMRSGYSSIMDLFALGTNALLVPTPGQSEQEYLADRMQRKGWFPTVTQNELDWNSIQEALEFPGLKTKKTSKGIDSATRFDVFLQGN